MSRVDRSHHALQNPAWPLRNLSSSKGTVVLEPSSKTPQTFFGRLLEKIQKIWRSFCNAICSFCSRKTLRAVPENIPSIGPAPSGSSSNSYSSSNAAITDQNEILNQNRPSSLDSNNSSLQITPSKEEGQSNGFSSTKDLPFSSEDFISLNKPEKIDQQSAKPLASKDADKSREAESSFSRNGTVSSSSSPAKDILAQRPNTSVDDTNSQQKKEQTPIKSVSTTSDKDLKSSNPPKENKQYSQTLRDLAVNSAMGSLQKTKGQPPAQKQHQKFPPADEKELDLRHLENHELTVNPHVVGPRGYIPSTPINEKKGLTSSFEDIRQITLPFSDKQILSHMSIILKGRSPEGELPAYVAQILRGDANNLLKDVDHTCHSLTNWAKEELRFLGECSCTPLSRTKNPALRRDFDNLVLAHVVPEILSSKERYCVTYFASGYLFAAFVQAVQILSQLKNEKWKGRLIWNVIDTDYSRCISSKFADGSSHTQSILCFKDQIAKIIPPEITFELNIFASHAEYVFATGEDQALKFNSIVGMDPARATYIWTKRELSLAGHLDSYEFLLQKPNEVPHHTLGKVKERNHLHYQVVNDDSKLTEGKSKKNN